MHVVVGLLRKVIDKSDAHNDGTVVNVALPVMQRSLGATVAEVQWIVEAYALLLASLVLVGGALGDRLGRRRVFSAGIVLFAIASAGCGLAPRIELLIAARAIQGVGAALVSAFVQRHGPLATELRTGTQIANVPSLRLYERLGFSISSASYVLHLHRGL